jgi:hypothetical protein
MPKKGQWNTEEQFDKEIRKYVGPKETARLCATSLFRRSR